jgi:hypothetical protein
MTDMTAICNSTEAGERTAESPTIGVALCTYNGMAFVGEQIASIGRQSRRPDLLVVSDDGSTDDTVARVEAAASDAGIELRLLCGNRLGITQNFARAVAACDTDVIFLCDQDDCWLPHKCEAMMRVFESDPAAELVFTDARLVDDRLQDLGRSQFDTVRMTTSLRQRLQDAEAFAALLPRNVVTGATVAFRRRLLDLALPFVNGWLHDEWLAILAAARGGLRLVPEPLVLYRQHGRNQCGMRPEPFGSQVAAAARTTLPNYGAERVAVLRRRLAGAGRPDLLGHLAALDAAFAFQSWREALPPGRLTRTPRVLWRLLRGGYLRHADGLRSAAKDLLSRGA